MRFTTKAAIKKVQRRLLFLSGAMGPFSPFGFFLGEHTCFENFAVGHDR
jgi:hypothetical protein